MQSVLINGKQQNKLDYTDRGLHYGDGLFETIACKKGKPIFWNEHLKRLNKGCEILNIPSVPEQRWREDIDHLITNKNDAVIKLILTRGTGGRGYRAPDDVQVTRISAIHPWPDYPNELYDTGVNVRICETPVSINHKLAGLKHLNRLENVLARNEWHDASIHEGLMLDLHDHVIEGAMSNLFAVKNNVVYTPELNQSGVQGIIRNKIMKIAEQNNIEVQDSNIHRNKLNEMDELFLTNSIIGIWRIKQLENHQFNANEITQFFKEKLKQAELKSEY